MSDHVREVRVLTLETAKTMAAAAEAFAVARGWTVEAAHVYADDGISGAEFANRPGFLRLMNALKPRAVFQGLRKI